MKFNMKFKPFRWGPNSGIQVLSLILAVILWMYVAGEQSVDVTLRVPLQVFPPEGGRMAVLKSSLQDITLQLSISRNLLSVISQQPIKALHRIKNVEKPGEYNFRIEPKDIILPPGNVRILDIYPEAVTVTLDEVIVQKLPIEIDMAGDLAKGYVVDRESLRCEPDAVLVEGPTGKLQKLKAVFTETINLVGRTRSFRKKARLILDPDLQSIPKDLMVDVLIPIRREYAVNVMREVPIEIFGTPAKLPSFVWVEPEKVDFTLRGPTAVLEGLSAGDAAPYIDISNLQGGEQEVALKFKLPKEVDLDQDPPMVKVKMRGESEKP
ncbi:MAG TPA: CdaR family protein [Candidatus Omnitrophota bacterium]|nr:CdaR family protein [Candidatus Omnitrophota bacterium]